MGTDDGTAGILARHAAGAFPAPMALTYLLLLHREPARLRAALARHEGTGELLRLIDTNTAGMAHAATLLDDHFAHGETGLAEIRRWRDLFDAAVKRNPETSVALYSLGDPARLLAATLEIAGFLDRQGLLGPDRDVLDLGCGIGRMELALAPRVRSITGIDLSPLMIEEAARRCADLGNVRLQVTEGRDLGQFEGAVFDLVLAVDSFPYLYMAGEDFVSAQVREVARVLRSRGSLLVLNLSYRGDATRDREDAERLATQAGLRLERAGRADLTMWDGVTYHFRKPA